MIEQGGIPNRTPNISRSEFVGTLAGRVFEEIKRRIITGELRPNQRLVESEIARNLSVSRTPVREALKKLETMRYVSILPNGGLVVTEHTPEQMESLFEIREALETMAIKLACQRSTEKQIEDATAYYHQAIEAFINRDYDKYIELHGHFHEALYCPCGNEQLLSLIRTFRYQYFDQQLTRVYNTLDWRSQIKQHSKILEAFRERNENKAEKALKRHLRNSLKIALYLH